MIKKPIKHREIAVIIYYDDRHHLYLQTRGSCSKFGEKYGFWGGGLNKGETPFVALQREIMEEIGYHQQEAQFFNTFDLDLPDFGWLLKVHIFSSPLKFDPSSMTVNEGSGFYSAHIDDLINNPDFDEFDIKVFREFKKYKNW